MAHRRNRSTRSVRITTRRTRRTASSTGASIATSIGRRSATLDTGSSFGPPFSNDNRCPIARGTSRMSENKMAASMPKRRTGCSVTSAARSGVRHSVTKSPAMPRTARYSGRYRPAWRISHHGGRGNVSPACARNSGLDDSDTVFPDIARPPSISFTKDSRREIVVGGGAKRGMAAFPTRSETCPEAVFSQARSWAKRV